MSADGDTRLGRIWPADAALPACVGTDKLAGLSLSRLDGEIYARLDYQAGAPPGAAGLWHVRVSGPDPYEPRAYSCVLPPIGFVGSCDVNRHPNAGWPGLQTSPRMEARQEWVTCKGWGQALASLRARREATIDQREINERNAAWDRAMVEADRAEFRALARSAGAHLNQFVADAADQAIARARPYAGWVAGAVVLVGVTWWGVTRERD